jgi:RNA polymerase sigma-70 factor (ECF subfamily)
MMTTRDLPAPARLPVSDDELIAASLERPGQFEELFRRHRHSIATYLVRRVGAEAGEELAAEVFVRAFDGRSRYLAGDGNARPWLFGIAAQLMHDHRRRERRRLRALARLPRERQHAPELPAHVGELIAALRRLPLATRETVLLRVWADLDYAEIARALDVPIGTVRSRLARAREALTPIAPPVPALVLHPAREPSDA